MNGIVSRAATRLAGCLLILLGRMQRLVFFSCVFLDSAVCGVGECFVLCHRFVNGCCIVLPWYGVWIMYVSDVSS